MTNPHAHATPSADPGRRLAEALHAQAISSGSAPAGYAATRRPAPEPGPDAALRRQIVWALVIALLAGLVLGAGIGLVSLLFPGVLPTVG
ncbi:hypothetical protein GCM10023215_40510 [Pseudonocardia yuanmonensis]|uniref:Uncharacterized protein n=1 Tax=Pseudonocardia yuanmonensis TaxID=1095914 RepID=A0ABP8X3A6_9PSEU